MIEKTYIMIKPDAVENRHIGEIIHRIERSGLTIERMVLEMVTPEQAAANYAEHKGKPFYDGLVSYITSGPVVKMVISGENAVVSWVPPTVPRPSPVPFAVITACPSTPTSSTVPTLPLLPSARSGSSSVPRAF